MSTFRIIPRLDIKGPNLVKGIHLEGLRVMGNPTDFARAYYESGADELLYMDVVASLYERNSLNDLITQTAREIFIPLTVGGGIRTLDDINNVLRAGADKVAINTAAINNPDFIRQAVRKFGSSTIVIAVEATKEKNGTWLAYTDNGREYTGINAIEWIERIQDMGAGEIMLTSIDREGTGMGFDMDFLNKVHQSVNVPLIVHGGAGELTQVKEMASHIKCDGVCISSMFHYHYMNSFNRNNVSSEEGNTEFLKSNAGFSKIKSCSIMELKKYLSENNIEVRL